MTDDRGQENATLLDVLLDGFEKNEMLHGFHWRDLPMPNEEAAVRKFVALAGEAQRWKGAPVRTEQQSGRQLAAWADLEIRQAGRAIMVRIKAPRFDSWWHERTTWAGDPMQRIFEWIREDESSSAGP